MPDSATAAGRPSPRSCPACGAESAAADARFCVACGSTLVAGPKDPAGARKVVTIVFADLAESTSLHERLDAESTRAFMDRYYRAMQGAVEAHGGTVTQLLGDGVKAVFGAPRVADSGTLPEGGIWESYIVNLATVVRGRITRIELFELEAVDAALARFAELRPDPLRIPPNAATRAAVRWDEALAAGDWETVEASYGPALVFEDRRRGFLQRRSRDAPRQRSPARLLEAAPLAHRSRHRR